ncbi:nuclear transport factor 2 family protein [Hymenobacter sp.]|uniref:nuclear transport factor 2 family protein n=1 Tax=Hymenobacter sp. TaxID=1898978 RepID=UPI00286BBF79|nr:nuclear transport factor 2 family protein [Hymenobacter sp.]
MKTFLLSLGAAALLALPAAGQSTATASARPASAGAPARPTAALSADEQLLTGLVDQVATAIEKHDMTALGKLMAPEYVHHNPNKTSSARAEELAFLDTWGPTRVKRLVPVRVNRYGNTAVTVSTLIYSGTEAGKTTSQSVQTMAVWVLRDGTWQMAVVQSKVMPA